MKSILLILIINGFLIGSLAQQTPAELTVAASFEGKELTPDAKLEWRLNRALQSTDGRLVVLIGKIDVTDLVVLTGARMSYQAGLVKLPSGETEASIYLVSPGNQWKKIGGSRLTIVSAATKPPVEMKPQAWRIVPSLNLGVKTRSGELQTPAAPNSHQPKVAEWTLQGGLNTGFTRGAFGIASKFNLVGTSYRPQALRYGLLANEAPLIDLPSYELQLKLGKTQLRAGHLSYGSNKYLIDSFESRGLALTAPLGRRADFSIAAVNGSSIVGWGNFFGLDNRDHQIVSSSLGYEFIPSRPGGLRVEASYLSGSLLPVGNINQNNLTDAEKSRGAGLRLIAVDKSERLHLEAVWSRSRSNNPTDPLLAQGNETTTVRSETSDAHFLNFSYQLLKDFKVRETSRINLTASYENERIAPLFRSVGATVQPNKLRHQFGLNGSLDELNVAFSHTRFSDNLDNIQSILKTSTEHNLFTLGLPLVSWFSRPDRPSPWLPMVSYSYENTRQAGAGIPLNGEFKGPQVPNQSAINRTLAFEWQGSKLRYGYKFTTSEQSNFGEKREGAKTRNWGNSLTFGLTAHRTLSFDFEVGRDRLKSFDDNGNKDKLRKEGTWRFSLNGQWRPTGRTALAFNLSNTTTRSLGDLSLSSSNRSLQYDLQWSWRFLGKEPASEQTEKAQVLKPHWRGQFFIGYSHRSAQSFQELFKLDQSNRGRTLKTGLNFTIY